MANDRKRGSGSSSNPEMKKASALDKATRRILETVDPTYNDRRVLSEQDAQFQRIIDRQLDIAHGVSGQQVVDFFSSIRDAREKKAVGRPKKNKSPGIDTSDLFMENVGDIFTYFQDVYKNKYMEVSDLKFISRFIPSLGEGVRVYLDSIISSDDVTQTITRNLSIPGLSSDSTRNQAVMQIEKLEQDYNILPKLKVSYKKAMVSGSFFVYHIAYKDLFGMYSNGIAEGKIQTNGSSLLGGNARDYTMHEKNLPKIEGKEPKPNKPNVLGIASESIIRINGGEQVVAKDNDPFFMALEAFSEGATQMARDGLVYRCDFTQGLQNITFPAIESMINDTIQMPFKAGSYDRYERSEYKDALEAAIMEDMPNIFFVKSPIPFDAYMESSTIAQEGYNEFINLRKDMSKLLEEASGSGSINDGTFDPTKTQRAQNFGDIDGTYLKWIDYKYMVPIEVLGQRVGYYHVITTPRNKSGAGKRKSTKSGDYGGILSSGSMSLFNQLDVSEKRKEEAIQNIVNIISDAILDQFSAKFVRKNAAFKKMIADCIVANGLVDNDYMIQFIPVDNVIEFKCNEDENGKGESILSDALFPAHLLLSIVICKLLNYINKGGNKTIAHISGGKVNKSMTNQVNRVLRDLQAGNVVFTDLLSSTAVFSKITRDQNISMPKDASGNKLVEFEVQEGQDINLNTEYEAMLDRWCMIAIGIPPSYMDYQNDVNIAKKIVSDNVKVAGRVASLQSDFEGPTTELYKYLIMDSSMDESMKSQILGSFQFKLPRPKILSNQNNSEALSTVMGTADSIVSTIYGEDATDEDTNRLKSIMKEMIVRENTPFIDWSSIDKMKQDAQIRLNQEKAKKEAKNADNPQAQENPDDSLDDLNM